MKSKEEQASMAIAFAREYFLHPDKPKEAAIKAGYSPKTASAQSCKLLKTNKTVKEELERLRTSAKKVAKKKDKKVEAVIDAYVEQAVEKEKQTLEIIDEYQWMIKTIRDAALVCLNTYEAHTLTGDSFTKNVEAGSGVRLLELLAKMQGYLGKEANNAVEQKERTGVALMPPMEPEDIEQ